MPAADAIRRALRRGLVIPAHPLALTPARKLDERRQAALTRYYLDAGAGGLAVGVHTTQFAIREPRHGLYRPVLTLAVEAARAWTNRPALMIAGVIGPTRQATREAALARRLGFQVALLGLGGLGGWSDRRLIAHAKAVADELPIMGFYLQPAVGGRPLGYRFWRALAELDRLVAIKVAPFDRYATLEVARAIIDAGRARDVALYTGNDDAILADLLTPISTPRGRTAFVGGLLGQWAVWTRSAVRLLDRCRAALRSGRIPTSLAGIGPQLTDANAAIFDAANRFRGCIPGIHEVLRRQGLLRGRWCLDPAEELSPGQAAEIDRVLGAYPQLTDDRFVEANRDRWLAG